jgi:rieske iron-sulfur protein
VTERGTTSPQPTWPGSEGPDAKGLDRRHVLGAALAFGVSAALAGRAEAAVPPPPKNMRPQEGDKFVFAFGDKTGQEIKPEDLPEGGPQIIAWPFDPKTNTARDGSRLNQVLLIRLDPASLDEETKARAADGVVAYAATCSHAQCPVTTWAHETHLLHCPCHQSEYDPRKGAKVVSGPSPRPLPALPLRLEDGLLTAAGVFTARVGLSQT